MVDKALEAGHTPSSKTSLCQSHKAIGTPLFATHTVMEEEQTGGSHFLFTACNLGNLIPQKDRCHERPGHSGRPSW